MVSVGPFGQVLGVFGTREDGFQWEYYFFFVLFCFIMAKVSRLFLYVEGKGDYAIIL